jgi:hypothetical protein
MDLNRRDFIRIAAPGACGFFFDSKVAAEVPGFPASAPELFLPTGKVPIQCRVPRLSSGWGFADDFLPGKGHHHVVRALDLLDLKFEWTNVEFTSIRRKTFVKKYPGQPAYLSVWFPSQHLLEKDYAVNATGIEIPVAGALCKPTRLVFSIPEKYEKEPLPLNLATMLHWERLIPSLAANALPPDYPVTSTVEPRPLTATETAIELPWGLLLSPDAGESWSHSIDPHVHHSSRRRAEMWHTELIRKDASASRSKSVRVVGFHGDTPPSNLESLPNQSVSDPDREMLLHETSNFNLKFQNDPHRYLPKHVSLDKLLLSSQGAYAKMRVGWPYEDLQGLFAKNGLKLSLDEWVQETIWGRDQYVKVSKYGYCAPFGNVVSAVEVRFREFSKAKDCQTKAGTEITSPVAVTRRQFFCVVRQPVLEFKFPEDGVADYRRQCPFKRIEISPLETPLLKALPGDGGWMYLLDGDGKEIFHFDVKAWDWDGTLCEFKLPLFWINAGSSEDMLRVGEPAHQPLQNHLKIYNDSDLKLRNPNLSGQKIAFAPSIRNAAPGSSEARDLAVAVSTMEFLAEKMTPLAPQRYPLFHPKVKEAKVRLAETAAFDSRGTSDEPTLTLNGTFLSDGFSKTTNPNEVFANINGADLNFSGGKSGGLSTPGIDIQNLSRIFGPVGGGMDPSVKALGGTVTFGFDPAKFFAAGAKLVGGIDLKEVIEDVQSAYNEIEKIPKLVVQTIAQIKEEIDRVKRAVELVKDLKELLSLNGAELQKEIKEQLLGEFQRFTDELLGNVLNMVLQQVPAFTEAVTALQEVAQQKHREITGREITDTIKQKIADILAAEALLKEICQVARDPDYLREVIGTRLKKELESKVAELSEQVRTRLAADLTDYIASAAFQKILLGATAFKGQLEELEEKLKTSAKAALEKAYPSPPPWVVEAVILAATHREMIQELLVSWHDVGKLKAKIREKAESLLGGLEKTMRDKIVAELEKGIENEIKPLLIEANQSLVQFQTYIEGLGHQADKVAEALDPASLVKFIKATVNQRISDLGQLILFPFSNLEKCVKLVADFANELDERPHVAIPRIGPLLKELQGHLEPIIGQAGLPAAELARIETIANGARDTKASFSKKIEDEIVRRRKDIGAVLGAGSQAEQAIDDYLCKIDNAGKVKLGALPMALGLDGAAGNTLDAWLTELNNLATEITKPDGWLQKGCSDVIGIVRPTLIEVSQFVASLQRDVDEITSRIPKEISFDYAWSPRLKSAKAFEAALDGKPACFTLTAKVRKSLAPDRIAEPPTISVEGIMKDFQLHLIANTPFINVAFKELSFISLNGSSPDVKVKIDRVTFGEALEFVQEFAKALSPDSGFFIELADGGLSAGYRFALPNLTSGALNIVQVSINTSISLPFDGSPVRAKFSLSDRQRPFLLSVGILGGGGFFGITLSTKGVEVLEGSLEFGAIVALDIGVATGVVSVTAGIYFRQERNEDSSLYGFVRASGCVRVIRIISITVIFYLGLGYEKRDGKTLAVGEAIVTVEIEMLFFSVSVDLHYRKEFEGSSKDSKQRSAQNLTMGTKVAPRTQSPRLTNYRAHEDQWKRRRSNYFDWNHA